MIDGVGEIGPRWRPWDFAAIVMIAPAHQRPAVVAAGLGNVDLVAAARAELALPEHAGFGVDCKALDVAMAVGPDFGLGARAVHEGVVGRDRTVRVDADELAQVVREILGGLELEALAGRDEQLAVRRESEAGAEVGTARDGRLLPEDHLKAFERCARRVQPTAAGGGRCATLAGLRTGEINKAVLGELWIERDIQEAALVPRIDARHAAKRRRELPVSGHDPQPARPLRHQHAAIRQEGQTPGVVEPARDGLDNDLGLLGLEALRVLCPGGKGGHYEYNTDQDGTAKHGVLPNSHLAPQLG